MLELTLKNGGTSQTPTIQNAQELYEIFNQIASEMRKQYTLGFYPETLDNKQHQLKIVLHSNEKKSKKWALSYRLSYQIQLNKRN